MEWILGNSNMVRILGLGWTALGVLYHDHVKPWKGPPPSVKHLLYENSISGFSFSLAIRQFGKWNRNPFHQYSGVFLVFTILVGQTTLQCWDSRVAMTGSPSAAKQTDE